MNGGRVMDGKRISYAATTAMHQFANTLYRRRGELLLLLPLQLLPLLLLPLQLCWEAKTLFCRPLWLEFPEDAAPGGATLARAFQDEDAAAPVEKQARNKMSCARPLSGPLPRRVTSGASSGSSASPAPHSSSIQKKKKKNVSARIVGASTQILTK